MQQVILSGPRIVVELEDDDPSNVRRADLCPHALRVKLGDRSSKFVEDRTEIGVNGEPSIEGADGPIQVMMGRFADKGPRPIMIELPPPMGNSLAQALKVECPRVRVHPADFVVQGAITRPGEPRVRSSV